MQEAASSMRFSTPSSPINVPQSSADMHVSRHAALCALVLFRFETGWWAKDGYVHYGITVRNPNSVAAANAVVQVTLFDEQGTVQGTWESAIGLVKAEQTVGFAGEAGDGLGRIAWNLPWTTTP